MLLPLADTGWVVELAIAELFLVYIMFIFVYMFYHIPTLTDRNTEVGISLLTYYRTSGCLRVGGLAAGSTATTLVDPLDAGWSSCAHPCLQLLLLPT